MVLEVSRRILMVAGTGGLGNNTDGVVNVASVALTDSSLDRIRYVPYFHSNVTVLGVAITDWELVHVNADTPANRTLYCYNQSEDCDLGTNHKTFRLARAFLSTGTVLDQATVWSGVPVFDEGSLLMRLVDGTGPIPAESIRQVNVDFSPVTVHSAPYETEEASTVTITGIAAEPEAVYTVTVTAPGYLPKPIPGVTITAARTTVKEIQLDRSAEPLPDLTGQWLSLTQRCSGTGARRRCELNGRIQIRNQGNELALSSWLRFYLSSDATWDDGDTLLQTVFVGALRPGKAQSRSLRYRLQTGQSASGQYVIAVIDATHLILESDERNNTLASGQIP